MPERVIQPVIEEGERADGFFLFPGPKKGGCGLHNLPKLPSNLLSANWELRREVMTWRGDLAAW